MRRPGIRRWIGVCALLWSTLGGCGRTPTEFSPLVRAVGEVRGVLLRFNGLTPLEASVGIYEAWALLARSQSRSLGRFRVDASGQLFDEGGAPIQNFGTDDANLRDALGIVITIEPPEDGAPERLSGFQILQGPFIEGVANLTVPAPAEITSAIGSYRVFTPTDGPGTNETSGLWALGADDSPSLSLPQVTQAFRYEAFVVINGIAASMGRIAGTAAPDSGNPFSGEQPAPQVPGEDFLFNAPAGLNFPVDLSRSRVLLTLEPTVDDTAGPSQLVVLETILPGRLGGEEIVALLNVAAQFPTGRAVLF